MMSWYRPRQDVLGCDTAILDVRLVLGVIVVVVVVVGVVGVVGDQAGPGYCGQGLLHASHSLHLRLL